jgi:hypothetical protein
LKARDLKLPVMAVIVEYNLREYRRDVQAKQKKATQAVRHPPVAASPRSPAAAAPVPIFSKASFHLPGVLPSGPAAASSSSSSGSSGSKAAPSTPSGGHAARALSYVDDTMDEDALVWSSQLVEQNLPRSDAAARRLPIIVDADDDDFMTDTDPASATPANLRKRPRTESSKSPSDNAPEQSSGSSSTGAYGAAGEL